MNISKQVIERLERLAAKDPKQVEALVLDSAQQPEYIVGVPVEEQQLGISLTLQGFDRYSVILRQLEVSRQAAAPADSPIEARLRHWAEQIIRRLSYLEEPLTLLELDAGARVAQLRSASPQQEGEVLAYWEAMVYAEPQPSVKLTRYCWSPDRAEREVAVYPATFGAVARIAQDMALCLLEQQAQ
ncbi:MAG: hypothetical protein AB1801_21610 [Chloroflexota bacterium]